MPNAARQSNSYHAAALAQELWREAMKAQGWKRARAYDQSLKRHDALVPFADLHPQDRRRLIARVESNNIVPILLAQVEHSRGDDRELSLTDMRVGRSVGLRKSQTLDVGFIESWTTEPNRWGGRARQVLSGVRIRWSDGEVTEHAVSERELRLLE